MNSIQTKELSHDYICDNNWNWNSYRSTFYSEPLSLCIWIIQITRCKHCGHRVFYQAFNGLRRCEECDWPRKEIFPNNKVVIVEMSNEENQSLITTPVCLVITDNLYWVSNILERNSAKGIANLLTPEKIESLYKDRSLTFPLILSPEHFKDGIEKDWINWGAVIGWQKNCLGRIDYPRKKISICRCLESSISPLWEKTGYQIYVE